MNKILVEQLREMLGDGVSLTMQGMGRLCKIEPILYFIVNDNGSDLQNKGFTVYFDNSDLKRKCKNPDTLLNYLKKERIVINDEAELVNISDKWKSYEEYIEHKKFLTITMEQLLVKYKEADIFSLTGVYNDGFSEEHPHGVYGIDEKIAETAIEKVSKWSLNMLRGQYERFTEEEKKKLPDFDSLVLEIQKECDNYFALVETEKIPEGQSPFLADLIYEGKTKYTQPQGIWHFYHEIYAQHMHYKSVINEMQKNTKHRDLTYIFDNAYYKELRECLIDTEVTFTWHCTTSSRLAAVYYFKINETSLNWLCKLKNDYDMCELEDLAFYKNGKVVFSSCTHESFHTGDVSET